jgi:hypothetical protein
MRIPSSSRSPDHDPHRTIYYLGYPLGRFAGLKHRQLARQVGVIITTGRIRRTLVNKIYLLVDSPRSIEASRLALVKAESIFLRRASGCFGSSRRSASRRLVVDNSASRMLVADYFTSAARPGASACRAARHAARRVARRRLLCVAQACRRLLRLAQAHRRLLHLRRASGCLGTSRGSSRGSSRRSSSTSPCRAGLSSTTPPRAGSSSTTPPHTGSSSTTSPPPRVRVPRHVARLITRLVAPLVVDYFDNTAHPGASARRAARRRLLRLAQARRPLLHIHRASGCLETSRGSSRGSSRCSSSTSPRRAGLLSTTPPRAGSSSITPPRAGSSSTTLPPAGLSSTTSPTPHVWVPRHVARLVAWLLAPLVVNYFASVARPGASAHRAARHAARRAARRRLLRLAQARR